jgi:cysteine-rich repeat protein
MCTLTFCGDGIIQNPNGNSVVEQCDDGNNLNNDGCNSICRIEFCGDNICQSGTGENTSSCVDDCPLCGDGMITGNEVCDPNANPNGCGGNTCLGCHQCSAGGPN